MSKNKQKPFLIGFSVVTGAAALGLLWLATSAGTAREEKAAEVNTKAQNILGMKKAAIYPKDLFAGNMADRSTDLVGEAEKLHTSISKIGVPWEQGLDGSGLQSKITSYRDKLKSEAKGRGATLHPGFALGLERYVDKAPTKSAAGRLSPVLESVNQALTAILATGIKSIDSVTIVESDWEKVEEEVVDPKSKAGAKKPPVAPAKPKTTTAAASTGSKAGPKVVPPALLEESVFKRFRVQLQFSGSEKNVQNALNTLVTSGEGQPFFVVNSFRIENEQKEAPSKEGSFSPEPITDEPAKAADGTAVPAPVLSAEEAINPEVVDARFILGNETISTFLDMDLILFQSISDVKENLTAAKSK